MIKPCMSCGPELREEERKLALVGMDAESLFPSMTGKRTGKIVRERINKSRMKIRGFSWKKGMAYIKMNRRLTSGIPNHLKKYLPVRKKNQGTEQKNRRRRRGTKDLQ